MADNFVLGVRQDRALVNRAIAALKALWFVDDDEEIAEINLIELTVGDLRRLVFGYLGRVEDLERTIEINRGADEQVTQ